MVVENGTGEIFNFDAAINVYIKHSFRCVSKYVLTYVRMYVRAYVKNAAGKILRFETAIAVYIKLP